jgi:hypothetical protein
MSAFWRNWLTVWGWAVVAFGVLIMTGAAPQTDAVLGAVLSVMNPAANLAFDPTHRFAFGLMGAVSAGWGLTFLVLFDAAHRLGAAAGPVWRGVAGATVVWYVVDSAISLATGFALNAASNTALLVALLVPLFAAGVLGGSGAGAAPAAQRMR